MYEICIAGMEIVSGRDNTVKAIMKSPVVDRAYRNYARRMVNLGLIKAEGKGRWKRYVIVS